MKLKLFLSILFTTIIGLSVFNFSFSSFTQNTNLLNVYSIADSSLVRIFVVRPSFWSEDFAKQFLRTADSADDLNNKGSSIQYFPVTGYTSDTYYDNSTIGDGTFNEYAADGIIYYDIPKSAFFDGTNYKFFDLIRENPSDNNVIWNDTGNHQFSLGMNHRILRIFGDGAGLVTSISGTEAESRNISDNSLPVVLSGYLSCESSNINGYLAYSDLKDNFDLEGRGDLSGVVFNDFSYTIIDGVVSFDYTISANRSVETNLQHKINRMKSEAGL